MNIFTDLWKTLELKDKVSFVFKLISVVGIALILWQAFILIDSIESNAHSYISTGIQDINKAFIDNPHLWPYFEEGQEVDKDNKYYYQAMALADLHLDFIDALSFQSDNILDYSQGEENWETWLEWIKSLATNSPVLCARLESTRKFYGKEFVKFMLYHCKNGQ